MPKCPVCTTNLSMEPRQNQKTDRLFLMLVCPENGAHFRAFINDRDYVTETIKRLGVTAR